MICLRANICLVGHEDPPMQNAECSASQYASRTISEIRTGSVFYLHGPDHESLDGYLFLISPSGY